MKKLFENWRKFEKEILNELDLSPGGGLETATMGTVHAQLPNMDDQLRKTERDTAYGMLQLVDLTNLTQWPEVVKAKEEYTKNPSYASFSWLTFVILTAIPLIGKAPGMALTAWKISRLLAIIDKAKDAERVVRRASNSAYYVNQIAKRRKEAEKGIQALRAAKKKTGGGTLIDAPSGPGGTRVWQDVPGGKGGTRIDPDATRAMRPKVD